jgi:hypothetical protein
LRSQRPAALPAPRRSGPLRIRSRSHDAADVKSREVASDGGGTVVAPHDNRRQVVWSRFNAFCFGLGPFDQPVCVRKRRYGASRPLTPPCHRWSQQGCGGSPGVVQISRLSADTSGGEQKSRPVQPRKRLTNRRDTAGGRERPKPPLHSSECQSIGVWCSRRLVNSSRSLAAYCRTEFPETDLCGSPRSFSTWVRIFS